MTARYLSGLTSIWHKSMFKTHLKRIEKLEEHFNGSCEDEQAYAEFCAWLDANPPSVPVDSDDFDFCAWCDSVPAKHQRGLGHWFHLALEAAKDKSRELVQS